MLSAWLPIRTVNLMGAPPESWLETISIGRSPAYFSFTNRLCYIIAIPWECQLKTVKKPCHKTHCRCPHRLNLSFQSSRSCALPNIKILKDKDLEFANSITLVSETPSP